MSIKKFLNYINIETKKSTLTFNSILSDFSFLFNTKEKSLLNIKSIPSLSGAVSTNTKLYWDDLNLAPKSIYDSIEYLEKNYSELKDLYSSYFNLISKIKSRNYTSLRSLVNVSPFKARGSVLKYNPFYNSFYLVSFEDLALSSVSNFKDLEDYTFESNTFLQVDSSETSISGVSISEISPYCLITTSTVFPVSSWRQSIMIVDNSTSAVDILINGPCVRGHDLIIHRKSTDFPLNIGIDGAEVYNLGHSFVFDNTYISVTLTPKDEETLIPHSYIEAL